VAVDGMDNNDQATGSVRATFSQDAVQEYQVITNPYGAEFGRTAGGVINIITKSGTNELHGGAFYYYRSDALATEDPLTNVKIRSRTTAWPQLRRTRRRTKCSSSSPPSAQDRHGQRGHHRRRRHRPDPLQGLHHRERQRPYEQQNTNVVFKLDSQLGMSNSVQLRGNYWNRRRERPGVRRLVPNRRA
jgi:outer membrane receptor protein involved in Fe transport